jgi:hypothetical protein
MANCSIIRCRGHLVVREWYYIHSPATDMSANRQTP